MAKRLYVGNLPYSMTDAELQQVFAQVGTVVDATVVIDRETGRSRGFGFVEMSDDATADAAIQQFNGAQVGGRTLRVSEANPRPSRGSREGRENR
ncbi:MAG: RNA-binding protein [Chloroflexi bacterium]|nr:RNA-binding protein [Chloroflexota bacterium]